MSKKTAKTVAAPAPVAPAKTKTAAPVAAPASPAPAGFRPAAYPPTARITIATEGGANPKRPGSQAHRAWGAYTKADGKPVVTVAEALARFAELKFSLRYARSALRWDAGHGFLKIEA